MNPLYFWLGGFYAIGILVILLFMGVAKLVAPTPELKDTAEANFPMDHLKDTNS